MAGQADGSIIVDTEVNPEGFKAGSSELLAAIKSLSSEVKELGKILKDAFSNNNRGIASTDGYVQQLEATVASLKQEVQSLQTKVAELQEQLNDLGKTDASHNPVTSIADSAQVADERVTELESEVKRLEGIITSLYAKLESVTSAPAEVAFDTSEAESKIEYLENKIGELENTIAELQNSGGTPSVNVSGTAGKASSLQKQIDGAARSVQQLEPTFQAAMDGSAKSMSSFKAKAAELEAKIKSLRQSLTEFSNTPVTSNEIKALEKDLAGVAKSIAATEEKAAKAEIGLQEYQKELSAIRNSTKAMMSQSTSKEQRNNLKQIEATQIEALNQKYAAQIRLAEQLAAKLSELDLKQQMLNQRMGEAKASATTAHSGAVNSMKAQIDSATTALVRMKAQAAQTEAKAHGISGAFRKVGTAVRTAAKSVGGALLKGLKKALQATKNLILHNNKYGRSFQKLRSIVGRFSLGLLGVRAIYGILSRAVTKFMESNQELSNQLDSCWTSLGNLLGPLFTKIIGLVTTAISYVTAFLKLLGITGSAAADATKEAGGAAEKAQRYLAGFDELNVMPDKSSSGGGADSTVEPIPDADLPKWVEDMVGLMKSGKWAEAAKTLTDNLNRLMDEVDWAGIGNKIGRGLDGALEFLSTVMETFNWEGLGSNLATSLNGIISNVDWGNLSGMLAHGLTGLMKMLTGFFSTLDGKEFGNAIHEFLRGGIDGVDWQGEAGRLYKALSDFIKAIDFKQLGTDLSDIVKTALQTISAAVTNFDWRALGQKIADFINGIDWGGIIADLVTLISDILVGALNLLVGFVENIDWGKLATDLVNGLVSLVTNVDWGQIISLAFELVGAALGAATNLVLTLLNKLWEMLCNGWESTKSYFADYIEESGGNIIEGLFKGILNALKNVGQWIVDNIFRPFIDGFCAAFGIHSPSTVMEEQGNFIIEGLLNGITNAWSSITDFIGNALSSIGDAISSAWSNVVSWTRDAWSNVTSNISSAWSNIKSAASSGYNAVKSGVSSAWVSIKSNASSAWSNVKSTISSAWSGIKSAATNGYNSVKSGIVNAWSSIRSNTATAWANIKNTIKNQGWSGIGSNICQGIGNGLSNGWNWLSRQVSNLARSMLNSAKRALGIHSPSRVFRDAVGLNIGYGIGEGIMDSEGSILSSVTGVADAIAEEFNAGTYGENLLPTAEVDGALSSFTDRIVESFAALLQKMDAIAKNVGFIAPAFAGSVAPYKATADASGTGSPTDPTSPDGVMAFLLSILSELQALSRTMQNSDGTQPVTKVIINGREVFQTVVDENNRAIRSNGKSPLKV